MKNAWNTFLAKIFPHLLHCHPLWLRNHLQGVQIRSTRRPRSMQNVMYIYNVIRQQTQRRREQSVKAKNATTKRVNYATNNKLLYWNAERKKKTEETKAEMNGEREREKCAKPSPLLLMHATLISLGDDRWLNFWPLRQIECACDTFSGKSIESALRIRHVLH